MPDFRIHNLMLPGDAPLTASFRPDLLVGVSVIQGKGCALERSARGEIAGTERGIFAIPYYAWASRGRGDMQVWIADNESTAAGPKQTGAPVAGGAH